MLTIIIGVILFLASSRLPLSLNKYQEPSKIKNGLRIAALLLIVFGVFTSCIKQIDAGVSSPKNSTF